MAQEQMKKFRLGPLYTPPSLEGTLQRPSQGGGASWGGAAFDPESGLSVRARGAFDRRNRVAKNDGTDPLVDAGVLEHVRARRRRDDACAASRSTRRRTPC